MTITSNKRFGSIPVFFTAISTILGAILFLRFGFAVGTLGFWGVLILILLGHALTIPTAFALSELATNKRVEGGGEYFIISRSFGLNIGATIGFALFLSQAISIAFYIIAFTEAFEFIFNYFMNSFNIYIPRQVISIPATLILGYIILKRGANMGMKMLYFVVAILFLSLLLFFLGKTEYGTTMGSGIPAGDLRNMKDFFIVFAIVFPAFTGMTAGVGLSGELRNPSTSIPRGTILATLTGMLIYIAVIYKLAISVPVEDMLADQLIMSRIAIMGAVIIPVGLAASTFSSAIGSILVAPRTLQALALDSSFPSKRINRWLSHGRKSDGEPANATIVTIIIAFFFVALGSVNAVAQIISMFFLVTYGSLCLISFLNHFGSSPSYRPSFKSRWYLSLGGFLIAIWVMFKINAPYAFAALFLMTVIYFYIRAYHRERDGLESLFANALFQVNRNIQVYLQRSGSQKKKKEWRPSAICISKDSFVRARAFHLLNWISYRYGFGTYLHRIDGYYSRATARKAAEELSRLIEIYDTTDNHVFVDTLISPSYTSALAQAIQVPGISGMENNMVIFEYDKENPENLGEIIENTGLIAAGDFDICLLASSRKEMIFRNGIHVWLDFHYPENSNLLILLSFIISGHPDWRKSNIKLFGTCKNGEEEEARLNLTDLVRTGRLPITEKNIEIVQEEPGMTLKNIINKKSGLAALTMIGFNTQILKRVGESFLDGYEETGTILFACSHNQKEIT
ncbi:MAG TPA: amino acid permease [Bacteroidales bacterium]|jgi:amino acid transporter|nr:amino acid permease [Bacteroidales bacterium]HQJ82237.1 amino acid permease [Bacteroidales bacterium]